MKPFLMFFQILISGIILFTAPVPGLAGPGPAAQVKNIILIIADGMGPEQLGLLHTYVRQSRGKGIHGKETSLDRLMASGGIMGMALTHAYGQLTTDSAAAGTQMASGNWSRPGMIGLNREGIPCRTIAEAAILAKKATGLVTNTRLTHATPAAFAAHQPVRKMENEIALDMLNSGVDIMMGGGLRHWIPAQANAPHSKIGKELAATTGMDVSSRRKDSRNLLAEARDNGYDLAFNRAGLAGAGQATGKVLGLFALSGMADGIDVTAALGDPLRRQPTLAEMADQALAILARDPDGFFLMIEAGQIDWAAHANDAGLMLHEMLHFNTLVHRVLDWTRDRRDTLVLITADHATGGFGFEYSSYKVPGPISLPGRAFKARPYEVGRNYGDPGTLDKLYEQQLSLAALFRRFDQMAEKTPQALVRLVSEKTRFPITQVQARNILAPEPSGTKSRYDVRPARLARAVAPDQNIAWASQAHVSTPVPVFALGPSQAEFSRILHLTDLGKKLFSLLIP